jgi:hypothetical protein
MDYELQGGRSERMTPLGGGAAPPYSALFDQLLLVAPKMNGAQIAAVIRDILVSGTMPGADFPAGAWMVLGEIFAVVKLPEMSRASFAPGSFAAAAHWAALGNVGLKEAFVGSSACYLGAEEGGAAALQGVIDSLSGSKRSAMERQEWRAATALATLFAPYVSKDLGPSEVEARLQDLHARMLGHLAIFEKTLVGKLAS